MTIDWWTVGLQAVNFLILAVVLHRFLYKPVRASINQRRAEIEEEVKAAEQSNERAAELAEKREAELAAIAEEREQVRREERERQERERREIVDEAREKAGEISEAVRRELAKERDEVIAGLADEITEMATDLARRLLEEARFEHASEPFFERLLDKIRAMSDRRREGLLRHVREDDPIVVVCAPPLPEQRWPAWRERLEELIGRQPIELADDDKMIAGVEIRFPHTNLRVSWRDALESARKEVHAHAGAA